jgi:Na+-transporting NADH:ubiquinone oxidoreductase subunit C
MNKQSVVYTIVFTFIVSFAFVFLLALTNEGLRDDIEFNNEVARQKAILNAMGVEYTGDRDAREKFDEVEQIERETFTLFRTTVAGEVVYAKEFAGAGLWGTIRGVIGVNEDASRTTGIEIVSHNETPGLGGRITEQWFKRQFNGEQIAGGIELTAGDGDYEANGEIDGITGATRTSESMAQIVNREIEELREALGGAS